jgi:hypothetical protein
MVASVITILRFLLINVFADAYPQVPNFFRAFGVETKAVLFLLVSLLVLFLAYSIARALLPKIREYILLVFVFALNAVLVAYASSLNFRVF